MAAGYLDGLEMDLMRRALAHVALVERVRDRSIAELEKQEAEFALNPEAGALHPAFKQLKMLNDCAYAMTDVMRTLTALKQGLLKTHRDEEKHAVKMGETTLIANAYQYQQEQAWGALQTADYIESQGGKVPPALLERVRHALKQGSEEDVENTVIDPEELDRQVCAYRATKRQQVHELVDQGGYGDRDHWGETREGELLASLDDVPDYDYAATEDIYDAEDNR
ncbi:hypothetical protein [Xenorhabdus szentirmaii]|uniref:Uncharacterized protein n=1 Tax=Xenorhabdus szentirmaii DSM 16338 TaxID=1427518 RepID=W1J1A1_9GAMM|nr:hypothetical protein [Xenorhabdus szentirmaii]PHM30476.1 hypothetical protein Xsze_04319 [Xenorhabdus szentirmaii DSM 16338]CDL83651.1 hypothetical protein XSR1_340051 [Xenorhabdus szentirmaii DSM 16338]